MEDYSDKSKVLVYIGSKNMILHNFVPESFGLDKKSAGVAAFSLKPSSVSYMANDVICGRLLTRLNPF